MIYIRAHIDDSPLRVTVLGRSLWPSRGALGARWGAGGPRLQCSPVPPSPVPGGADEGEARQWTTFTEDARSARWLDSSP